MDSIRPELERVVQAAVRDALVNVPTTDTVERMIAMKLEPIKVASGEQINSIDKHLRQSEEMLKTAARAMDEATARFVQHATQVSEHIGALTATDTAQQERINRLEDTLATMQAQSSVDRASVTALFEAQRKLNIEIHGNPTDLLQESVIGLIAKSNEQNQKRFDELVGLHNTLGERYNHLNERLAPIEAYITTQRGLIRKAKAALGEVLKTTRGKLLFGGILAALSALPETSPIHAMLKQLLGLP